MRIATLFTLIALSNLPARAQMSAPIGSAIPAADRTLLAEAFRLAAAVEDSVWPGWSAAPFPVLLVAPDREYLVRQSHPSPDFARAGYDSLLASDVYVRPRQFPVNLLATFPAVAGVPTIVIGEPGNTGKHSTAWVLTLMHEHFHQLQYSRPDYQAGVRSLDLAHGDQSGMWMLNFPFPYDSAVVQARYATFAGSLAQRAAPDAVASAIRARTALQAALSAEQYRYLAFQLWQEGVARYTELAVARRAAAGGEPAAAFRALPDYTTYAAEARRLEQGIESGITAVELGEEKRVAFYATGPAYALLLDAVAPGWRDRYFETGFSLDPLLR
jgi:hypothetical protein